MSLPLPLSISPPVVLKMHFRVNKRVVGFSPIDDHDCIFPMGKFLSESERKLMTLLI